MRTMIRQICFRSLIQDEFKNCRQKYKHNGQLNNEKRQDEHGQKRNDESDKNEKSECDKNEMKNEMKRENKLNWWHP
jgi:hypothetical protein